MQNWPVQAPMCTGKKLGGLFRLWRSPTPTSEESQPHTSALQPQFQCQEKSPAALGCEDQQSLVPERQRGC